MKITEDVRKKYLATKFIKEILSDLKDLTLAEKTKVENALKTLTISAGAGEGK